MKQPRSRQHKSHPERWLVSYADFMTLLFALFVVLFASSHHNNEVFRRFSSSVKSGFSDLGTFSPNPSPAGTSQTPNHPPPPPIPQVIDLQKKLQTSLGNEIERKQIGLKMTPEGLVISLHELGFFESGQASLLPGADATIRRIAGVLNQDGLDMRIEGHSDNVPIHNTAFASNWDLSTARANTVAMILLKEAGIDPQRISIAGYGQYHPAESNDTPEGRRANRRVDIVLVALNAANTPARSTTP